MKETWDPSSLFRSGKFSGGHYSTDMKREVSRRQTFLRWERDSPTASTQHLAVSFWLSPHQRPHHPLFPSSRAREEIRWRTTLGKEEALHFSIFLFWIHDEVLLFLSLPFGGWSLGRRFTFSLISWRPNNVPSAKGRLWKDRSSLDSCFHLGPH